MPAPFQIVAICTGNICRSPLMEVMLRRRLQEAGLAPHTAVTSAATTAWEEGAPAYPHSVQVAEALGLDLSTHRAHRLTDGELAAADLLLAADSTHLQALSQRGGSAKTRLLRSFDPQATSQELRDPWGAPYPEFERAAQLIEAALPALVDYLASQVGRSA